MERTEVDATISKKEIIKVMLEELRPSWIVPKDGKVAQFKARIQVLGRIVIPEPEREIMNLHTGDIVQIILWKVEKQV